MTAGGETAMTAAVEIRDLTRRFGPVTAVDHLTLTIPRGNCSGWSVRTAAGKPRP